MTGVGRRKEDATAVLVEDLTENLAEEEERRRREARVDGLKLWKVETTISSELRGCPARRGTNRIYSG